MEDGIDDVDIPVCGDVFDDGSDFVYRHDPGIDDYIELDIEDQAHHGHNSKGDEMKGISWADDLVESHDEIWESGSNECGDFIKFKSGKLLMRGNGPVYPIEPIGNVSIVGTEFKTGKWR
jgi:hypothetical protein